MTKLKARAAIVKLLKQNNWYAVIHSGHFGMYFHIMDFSKIPEIDNDGNPTKYMEHEVYAAMYEEFNLKFYFNNEVKRFNIKYSDKRASTWGRYYKLLKDYLKLLKEYLKQKESNEKLQNN